MKSYGQLGRFGVLVVLGIGAAEILIMISPFAGFFYSTIHFEPLLGFLSKSPLTAWVDGFFLNHSVVTRSTLLEWQRGIGTYVFALGIWGFFISAFQVYGNKITRRGVAKGLLYRYVRHPQYLCLAVAGLGLLTIWPRFLLLGTWVIMLFLYGGLARFEERRMEERFGEEYRRFAATRGCFLPGSPVRSLFEATFGKVQPRALGWAVALVFCLGLAYSLGFALRSYTRASAAILFQPQQEAVIVSAWPKSEEWMKGVFHAALDDQRVRQRLQESRDARPLVATILPPKYVMKGMFYKDPSDQSINRTLAGFSFARLARLATIFLLPKGVSFPRALMGVDPDTTNEPVQLVLSSAQKPYKKDLLLEEALDPGVRLRPLVVVTVVPATGAVKDVLIPLPQNFWGPNVVMPLL